MSKVIQKIVLTVTAYGVGLVVGTLAATPVIAFANAQATDGPNFPAPMVAFGFIALPIGFLLLIVQAAVAAYELVAKRSPGNTLLVIGVVSGLIAGLVWYVFLSGARIEIGMLIAACVIGIVQGVAVFGCHWIAHRLSAR